MILKKYSGQTIRSSANFFSSVFRSCSSITSSFRVNSSGAGSLEKPEILSSGIILAGRSGISLGCIPRNTLTISCGRVLLAVFHVCRAFPLFLFAVLQMQGKGEEQRDQDRRNAGRDEPFSMSSEPVEHRKFEEIRDTSHIFTENMGNGLALL